MNLPVSCKSINRYAFVNEAFPYQVDPATFKASEWCATKSTGGYAAPFETNCSQYVKCFLSNGLMNGEMFTCTSPAKFDPFLRTCSNDYKCV